MDPVPLFLNEMSYPISGTDADIEKAVITLLQSVSAIKELKRPFILGGEYKITQIPITEDHKPLSGLVRVMDREWWRFVNGLDQRAPQSEVPNCTPPAELSHLIASPAMSPLWATENEAFLLSFPSSDTWNNHVVEFQICSCEGEAHLPQSVECSHISSPAHVAHWKQRFLDYRLPEGSSSTIYQSNDFSLRMFLHDHDPPHVHVYDPQVHGRWVAKVRIDFYSVLKNQGAKPGLLQQVSGVVRTHSAALMRSWEKCRDGGLPNRIDGT